MNEYIEIAISVVIVACWIASAVFVVGYGIGAPWYRSEAGRQIFFSGVMFFGVCSLVAAAEVFGTDYAGRPYIRLLVWSQVLVFLLWRDRILVSTQFRKDYPHGGKVRDGDESVQQEVD